MDRQHWEQIKDLFERALELAPEARASFVVQACADNAVLRSEVEALLDHDRRAGSFLEGSDAADIGIRAIASVDHPTLSPGEVLSGRFKIVQFLGRGGMGEVYEAKDLELSERIALKTIRPEIAFEPRSLARFKQEIQLARRITHPNVCRMFDLGRCQVGPPASVVTFLTMELIKGQTLAAELHSRGRMTTAEALPLIQQMAEALGAAHDVGVVHRDFKPGNVMLAAAKSDAKVMRAVVTDFGLARAFAASVDKATGESTASSVTSSGHHLGTLAYMAPEQLEGREATASTDVYSLGLVIYEMVTGNRPFPENAPLGGIYHRLTQLAPSPRVHVPDLEQHWERTILRCLEADPGARFQSAGEVAAGFARHRTAGSYTVTPRTAGVRTSAPKPANFRSIVTPAERLKNIRKIGPVAAAIVLAALMAAAFYWRSHRSPKLTTKDTIVLADFLNTTGDSVFDSALRQGLSAQLEQSPFINLLSDERIVRTLKLMTQPKGALLTHDLASEVCQRTGSTATMEGSIASLGNQYVLGLKALNCHSGDLLAEEQATANGKEEVLEALGEAATRIRKRLGESLASVAKYDAPPDNVTTSSLEALQAYSLGYWAGAVKENQTAAIPFFQRAVRLDPNFAMAYARMGDKYSTMGEPVRAAENSRRAYELRERVSERERFYIDSHYEQYVTGDLEAAQNSYESWAQRYPRDDTPPTDLGFTYQILGEYHKALAADQHALKLDPSGNSYANLVDSYLLLNRLHEAQALAREAQARHLDIPFLHRVLYLVDFLQHDAAGMQREAAFCMSSPGNGDNTLYDESDTAAYTGHLVEARELTRRAADAAERDDEKEAEAGYEAEAAVREALVGNTGLALQLARAALALSNGRDVEAISAIALGLASESGRAISLANDLNRRFPKDTMVQFEYLPMIRAGDLLGRKSISRVADKVIEALAAPEEYELGSPAPTLNFALYPAYVRGEAYLEARQGVAAAAEFQKILDHPGVVVNEPIGALAHLGLGRAYSLEAGVGVLARFSPLRVALNGDRPKVQPGASAADALAKARAAYQDFFALWRDADPDIPILHEAKAEYANLQRSAR